MYGKKNEERKYNIEIDMMDWKGQEKKVDWKEDEEGN